VDTGLLRANEAQEIKNMFNDHLNVRFDFVYAEDIFLKRLEGIVDPEEKRKIIGKTFIELFENETKRQTDKIDYLVQGTLYPDVIESVSVTGSPSAVIKSHHNVGGLPDIMNLKLVEPLRELFKDEVREIGRILGLPKKILGRHPFPGPGLAIRIIGEVTREKLTILRQADKIFIDELYKWDLYDKTWQAFVVLTSNRSVGVMGDDRTYDYTAAIRAVDSIDGMTCTWTRFPHDFIDYVANRITNEVQGVNRVVLDVTSKPPGTIEWE
jgi:GMP synthase (glutamine-hydrolysing) B subunit